MGNVKNKCKKKYKKKTNLPLLKQVIVIYDFYYEIYVKD